MIVSTAARSFVRITAIGATLLPTAAVAHVGVGHASGFAYGFAHPLSGLDHMLAMVMVGVFAWQLGGRALRLVPTTFVAVMALGGALGWTGADIPFVEIGIALSVVVLGAIVAMRARTPVTVAMGLVGLFAIVHGHAHGAEMPTTADGLTYAAGFMIATALLHVAGIGIGLFVGRISDRYGTAALRTVGAITALAGIGLLTGQI